MSGYGQYALGYHDRGWSPLPLPHGAKWPPPDGMTGATAPAAERSDVEHWIATRADANIALRLPERVIGIDVDAYKPNAVATMQRLEAAAPMPPTWRSSSRGTAGNVPYESGIYLYRVPDGVPLDLVAKMRDPRGADGTTKDSDVELIRHGHRYIVAAPSMSSWSAPRKLAYEAISKANTDPAGAFERAKLAKITAETLQIVQVGECRAFGLNHDARGSDGGTVVVIEREQATDVPGAPTAELPSPEPLDGSGFATPDGEEF